MRGSQTQLSWSESQLAGGSILQLLLLTSTCYFHLVTVHQAAKLNRVAVLHWLLQRAQLKLLTPFELVVGCRQQ
jgi:hypothetical protein